MMEINGVDSEEFQNLNFKDLIDFTFFIKNEQLKPFITQDILVYVQIVNLDRKFIALIKQILSVNEPIEIELKSDFKIQDNCFIIDIVSPL